MADHIPPSRPSSDTAEPKEMRKPEGQRPAGPYVGRPLDGSQYLDVVEEQEYADRRPTPEEQKPRHAYRVATDAKPASKPVATRDETQ